MNNGCFMRKRGAYKMTKVKMQFFRSWIALLAAIAIIFSSQYFAPVCVSAAEKDVEINISNLTISPSPASGQQEVSVKFDYQFTLTASGTAHFEEGDIIEVQTNFTDMFDSDSSFSVPVSDHGGNQLGELNYNTDDGTVSFTVSEAAANMEYHTFTGTFDSFRHFKAKNVDTQTGYTVTAGIGATTPASAEFSIIPLERQLRVQSSGHGSLSGITGTITLSAGDTVEITATPDDSGDLSNPYQVLAATLVLADNTRKAYKKDELPSSSSISFNIGYDDLKPGINTFVVSFTPAEETDNEEGFYNDERNTSIFKRVYNRNWGTQVNGIPVIFSDGAAGMSANNDIYVNTKGIIKLYGTEGDETNSLTDLIVEDTLPGGAVGTLPDNSFGLRIYAVMPYWFTGTDGKTKAINPESGKHVGYKPPGAAGHTELTTGGYLENIEQQAGETLGQFRSRIASAPLSYGVFVDPRTNETTWIINFGSPGDPDGPALKCSDLWPVALARDTKLNEINGDDNCVGGNVQYFRIKYYCDHNKVRYTSIFTNTARLTSSEVREESSVQYAVQRENTIGEGHKSTLTVHVVDALDQSHDIAGVKVKLEKWNDQAGAWEDARHEGRTYEGVTGADGELVLGESDGSVETGTLTPGRYRIREVSLPENYSDRTMTVTTAPSSQGPISADGEFTVAATDTKGFVALVTFSRAYDVIYHANGGEGELVCPDNPHPAGTKAAVLAPGNAITRSDYYFVGWNTKADGDGEWYAPGDRVTIVDGDIDLYAQWKLNTKTNTTLTGSKVWDDLENASGKRPAIDADQGQPIDLELVNLNGYKFPDGKEPPKPTWTQDDKDPNKWHYTYTGLPRYDAHRNLITWCVVETPPAGYKVSYENSVEWDYMTDRAYPGGVIKNTLKDVTITYKLNGGSYKGSGEDIKVVCKPGTRITIHDAPERGGHTFLYWEGSEYYPGQEYQVTGDHVFTARWKKQENGGSNNGFNIYLSSSNDRNKSSGNDHSKSVKTGDNTDIPLYLTAFTAASLLLMLLYRRKRR